MSLHSHLPARSLGVFNSLPEGGGVRRSPICLVGAPSPTSSAPTYVLGYPLALQSPARLGRVRALASRAARVSFVVQLPSCFAEADQGGADPLSLPIRVRLPDFSGAAWARGNILTRMREFVSCYGVSGPWFSLSFLPPVAYWMPFSDGHECLHFRGMPLQLWITGGHREIQFDMDEITHMPVLRIHLEFILGTDQEAYRDLMDVIGGSVDDALRPQYAEARSFFPHSSIIYGGLRDATSYYTATQLMPRLHIGDFQYGELDMLECLVLRPVSPEGPGGGFLLAEQLNRLSPCGRRPEALGRVGLGFPADRRV